MAESDNNNAPSAGPPPAAEILRLANIIYFRSQVFDRTEWMGYRAAKCPMDMWIYQELMHKLGTDLLIETGTLLGGSALFFAHMFDLMGRGKVISVDIEIRDNLPQHPRIEYVEGSSVATGLRSQGVVQTCGNAFVLEICEPG
jgi:cephalosporin hydroxylase